MEKMTENEHKDIVDALILTGTVFCTTENETEANDAASFAQNIMNAAQARYGEMDALSCLAEATDVLSTLFKDSIPAPMPQAVREWLTNQLVDNAKITLNDGNSVEERLGAIARSAQLVKEGGILYGSAVVQEIIDEAQQRYEALGV